LLKHSNKWWCNEARRLLSEREYDEAERKKLNATLIEWVRGENESLALEGLWTLSSSGVLHEADVFLASSSPFEHVRAWAVRLYGDGGGVEANRLKRLLSMAESETSPVVLAQLACSTKNLPPAYAAKITTALLNNPATSTDPLLANLVWWAVEAWLRDKPVAAGMAFAPDRIRDTPLRKPILEKVARRLAAEDVAKGDYWLAELLVRWKDTDPDPLLRGLLAGMGSRWAGGVPPALRGPLDSVRKSRTTDELLLEALARMSDPAATVAFQERVADAELPDAARVKAVDLLKQLRKPATKTLLLAQFDTAKSDPLRLGLLGGLEAFDDGEIGTAVLAGYAGYSPAVKKRAVQLLLSRPAWAVGLLKALDAGMFSKTDVSLDQARAAVGLGDKDVTALVEKHFGRFAPATAGEKQARITWLNVVVGRGGPGDAAQGKALFAKHCVACHQFRGEGGKVGPDITTADRKNRGYMLAQIVDPSGYIRPEYVVQNVVTADGRKLSGIAAEGGGTAVTLVNVVNNQPQKTVVAKADIETMTPSAVSLMPEKLLDTLSDAEVTNLFAYLTADDPKPAAPPATGAAKKLKVCLVSGSFEYKSDDSLAAFQKHLEANYPVECTRAFAKAEKDKDFPGLELLESADVAIFFTRRLQIEGAALDRVKKYVASGKPVVGVRTASHGFQNWLEMDELVFGGDYKNHFGQGVACEVKADDKAKDHPVLKGVGPITTRAGLYKNPAVAADVTVLLRGSIPGQSEPVAWVREKDGRRVFYTSLGHADDFKDENFIRLLTNGLAWATKTELEPKK